MTAGIRSQLTSGNFETDTNDGHILIGRYTTLGANISFRLKGAYGESGTAACSLMSWSPTQGLDGYGRKGCRNQIVIGNDVRIESDVVIVGGLAIGNGAIIRAGAVLTGDVPPYAVVEGNPARVIHYRFDKETIARLQQIKWWNWSEAKIRENISRLEGNVTAFLEENPAPTCEESGSEAIVQVLQNLREQGYRIYYFVPDGSSPEEIWRKVFHEYLSAYSDADQTALLLGISPGDDGEAIRQMEEYLQILGEEAPLVLTYERGQEDISSIMRHIDRFITTKEERSSLYVDYACGGNVKVLYGLDWKDDIFPRRKNVDVSVCVCTYNPDYSKLFTTLTSIIQQKNCAFELLVGDDGTPDFRQFEIEQWLLAHHFKDYTIVHCSENKGTVNNVVQVLSVARGRYIKTISPGDYLYCDSVLGDMQRFMDREKYAVAFGRACYYSSEGDAYKLHDIMYPLDLHLYEKKDYAAIKKACVIYGDFILGAALMGERRLIMAYTNEVSDHIVYGEDTIYIRMIADDVKIGFWNQYFLWYEFGIGISTCGSEEWRNRLKKDMAVCLSIIQAQHEEIQRENEKMLRDNPGKTPHDIQLVYQKKTMQRHIKEHGSYLKDVDVRELEQLVHKKVIPPST